MWVILKCHQLCSKALQIQVQKSLLSTFPILSSISAKAWIVAVNYWHKLNYNPSWWTDYTFQSTWKKALIKKIVFLFRVIYFILEPG